MRFVSSSPSSSMSLFAGNNVNERVNAFLNGIPYTHASGMRLHSVGEARAALVLPARPEWTGDALRGLVHPGCASVLADTACGVAVGTALETPVPFATLDLRMDYLRPAVAGADLICQAHCHRVARSVAFVRGEVFQSGGDEPVALVNAAFMLSTAAKRREPAAPGGERAPGPAATVHALDLTPAGPETETLPAGGSPYVEYLGVRRTTLADGTPLFRLPFRQDLIGNPVLPALHGGVLAGFAETALVLHPVFTQGLSPQTGVPKGIDFLIDYLRSARPVDTFAHCITVRQGSRVALVQASLWQDDPSRPVAVARGHLLLPNG
ncbi:MAG: hotdog fold thioesterase [Aquabacterium sp.]|jgi:uncharacterized protein (TIGR00369 family)|nr:MAG: hotdog fold thioesterase [Aquabacterium sp.]